MTGNWQEKHSMEQITEQIDEWTDITRQSEAQKIQECRQAYQGRLDGRMQAILDACPMGCHFWNNQNELMDCNQAAVSLFGYDTKEAYLHAGPGKIYSRLRPGAVLTEQEIVELFAKVKRQGNARREFVIENRAGIGIPCEVSLTWLKDIGFVSYIRDLREIEEKNDRIEKTERKNHFDELTGIYSRSFFMEESGRLFDYCSRQGVLFGLILISIDRFRIVNSDSGREAGDYVLRTVAEMLRKNNIHKKMDNSQVYARYNGSKFLVGLVGYDRSGTWKFAEELREEAESSECLFEDEVLPLTLSIGIATIRDSFDQLEELFYWAENAMYDARLSGGNCIRLFDEATNEIVAMSHFL